MDLILVEPQPLQYLQPRPHVACDFCQLVLVQPELFQFPQPIEGPNLHLSDQVDTHIQVFEVRQVEEPVVSELEDVVATQPHGPRVARDLHGNLVQFGVRVDVVPVPVALARTCAGDTEGNGSSNYKNTTG